MAEAQIKTEEEDKKVTIADVKPQIDDELEIKVQPSVNLTSPQTKAIVQEDLKKQEEEGTVNYDKLISGEMTEVGGTKVDFVTRTLAKEGHVPSIIKLEKLAQSAPKSTDVRIGGVRKGEMLPFTGLSEDQVEDLTRYTTGRVRILNALKQNNPEPNEPRVAEKESNNCW